MASKSLSAYSILKKFCHQEGLYHTKRPKDTNNGSFVFLEVRTNKTEGQGVIFSKVKWFMKGCVVKNNIFNLLAFEFFEAVGVSLVNSEYWLTSKREVKPQKRSEIGPGVEIDERTFDDQLDDALAEAEAEAELGEVDDQTKSPTVKAPETNPMSFLGDFTKMMGGIKNQSLPGMMEALSTPGGLNQVGAMLQNPMFNQMMSVMVGGVFQAPKEAVQEEKTLEIPEVIEVDSSSDVLLEKVE